MARQARAGPDVAPGVAGDHLLKLRVELGQGGQAAVDMRVSKDRATDLHALVITLFFVHENPLNQPTETPARAR
ncbi:hypothetical protein D9M71_703190 [compost metagenome]